MILLSAAYQIQSNNFVPGNKFILLPTFYMKKMASVFELIHYEVPRYGIEGSQLKNSMTRAHMFLSFTTSLQIQS